MDKDRVKENVKEKMEDMKGRAKRHGGEFMGAKKTQVAHALDQAKWQTQQTFGKMKDAGREALGRGKEHVQEFGKPHQNIRPKKPAA